MITREELYKKFGPLLLEAICDITMSEINLLRVKVGLPERTKEQFISALNTKLNNLDKYFWMASKE